MFTPTNVTGYQSPFEKPLFSLPGMDSFAVLSVIFFFIFAAWAAYTIIVTYHWFRYSHRSWLSIPAIATHIVVSGLLIFYIATGV